MTRAQFEYVAKPLASSFKAFSYEKPEFDAAWHFHPEYELTYIIKSNGIRYVGDSIANFEEGDLVLLGPNLPHCWKNTDRTRGTASAIVIQWNDSLLGEGWLDKPEFAAIKKLFASARTGVKFNDEFAFQMKEKLFSLLSLSPLEKLLTLLELLQTLASTTNYSRLSDHEFPGNPESGSGHRIDLVYQYVGKNYGEKITLKKISRHLHMTEGNFSRFFSRMMKKPFFTFLNEYRMNIACRLLVETDWQVKEISYAAGYESLPFFFRQFKTHKLMTPQQYRAIHK